MSFSTKRLGSHDIDLMHGMLDCFSDVFAEPENYSTDRPDTAYLRSLLADPTFIAMVAVDDDKVVGALSAYELKKYEQARSEIFIYDLAVRETYRRQGIATALIENLKPIALERGAWVIIVQADYGDDPAINLYTKLGKREEILHFDIRVDQTS